MSPDFIIDHSKKFTQLPNAPIVEAILHWQAKSSIELNDSLKETLSSKFPKYKIQPQRNIETAFENPPPDDGFRLTKKENEKPVFVCQLKPDGLIVSRLAPYENWNEFQAESLRFWEAFLEIAKPTDLHRLSTRFISKVELASISDLNQYLDVATNPLNTKDTSVDSFFHKDSLEISGHPYTIDLVRMLSGKQLIVDIDVRTTESIPLKTESLSKTLADLRFIKNEVFFNIMKNTDEHFGETS